jgi:hypothetical protein
VSWGGLNNALTAWRNAVMARFPDKDSSSDGARADAAHGSNSQHQEDADGTVDAYDMDVNLLRGTPASGTPEERRLIEAMKLDFEQDPHGRGRLWIHQREIANEGIGPWSERPYSGWNPHDKHVHWESLQAREDDGRTWPMPHTDRVLREMRGEEEVDAAEFMASVARGVKGGPDATGADRTNRNNFASGVRFALGLEDNEVTPETLPCGPGGMLDQILDRLPEGPDASEAH